MNRVSNGTIAVTILTLVLATIGTAGPAESEPNAFDGYTLVAPLYHTTTYLIDMNGKVVHAWESDCTPGASAYLLENGNLLRTGTVDDEPQAQPRRGGTPFGWPGMMPPGGGMADKGGAAGGRVQEIDWDGQVVWEFKFAGDDHILHHDIERLPNGNILMIAWEKKTAQEVIAAGRDPRFQGNSILRPDFVIEVEPKEDGGEIVWEWHVWDHLIQDYDSSKPNYGDVAAHPELIDLNFSGGSEPPARTGGFGGFGGFGGMAMMGLSGTGGTVPPDWTHMNAVAYNADLDQIVLSSYGFSEIWIIDHSTTQEEAAGHTGGRYGKGGDLLYRWGNPRAYRAGTAQDQRLFNQHDPYWIPAGYPGAGNILVFNNGPYRPDGAYSSVDEIVLPVGDEGYYARQEGHPFGPEEAVWSYVATDRKTNFHSMHISGAERLPNGNTLICSGAYGMIFEVTPDKQVLWRCAFSGGEGPNGPDFKNAMGGGGFGMPPGGPGGFGGPFGGGFGGGFGTPFGVRQRQAPQKLPRFVVSREDPAKAGTEGMPRTLPTWGGGTGFGNAETQIFRVYRYAKDYPGLAGKDLTPEE